MKKSWSEEEQACLRIYAGKRPVSDLAEMLGRSESSVVKQAAAQGLSLRCPLPLYWCDRCAKWRTELTEEGICRVCQADVRIQAAEASCAREMDDMADRHIYESSEALRSSPARARPRLRMAKDATPYQKVKAEAEHAAAVEAWEMDQRTRELNAARQRLKRMRDRKKGTGHGSEGGA